MPNDFEKQVCDSDASFYVFLDEVGETHCHELIRYEDSSFYPVHTVAASIFTSDAYRSVFLPGLDDIKRKYFNSVEIVLHSREIRRKDGVFKIFLDDEIYSNFKSEIVELMNASTMYVISSSINKIKLRKKADRYKEFTGVDYNIGDIYLKNVEYLLERLGHMLGNQRTAKLFFEVRGPRESKQIQGVLDNLRENGSFYHSTGLFTGLESEIGFYTKEQNINGLQIADYCAYPLSRHCKNPEDEDNLLFEILLNKHIYPGDFGMYGLKEWP